MRRKVIESEMRTKRAKRATRLLQGRPPCQKGLHGRACLSMLRAFGLGGGRVRPRLAAAPTKDLLAAWTGGGDQEALDALITRTYEQLRRLARRYLGRERANHTLQSTGLLHEVYLRLVQSPPRGVRDRAHFCGIAAHLMREILVDHARKHAVRCRDGMEFRISLDEAAQLPGAQTLNLLDLDDAL